MTAGYDDWALARTPSLLAFATALTCHEGSDDAAADAIVTRAVTRALTRVRDDWTRVYRNDPDLVARRHLVRACSRPGRAAAVLRGLENRTDAEIADVLGCSEAAARHHLRRGLAQLASESVDPSGDRSVALQERLQAAAGSAPTQLLTRAPATSPEAALTAGRRRRRGAWWAALAVLALVGGSAYAAHQSRTYDSVIRYPKAAVPDSWRHESYAGVQLQVPDTWGWGGSPVRSSFFPGPRHLGSCGADVATQLSPADPATYVTSLTPFVGRPAMLDERCVDWGADGSLPEGEAVWFDSPYDVGVEVVGGTVAETRAAGSQHVTVFAADSALRRRILGTVEEVAVDADGCPTRAVDVPSPELSTGRPTSMSVCVYSQDSGVTRLLYSADLPSAAALGYAAQVTAAPASRAACTTPQGQWVALGLHSTRGTRWDVVNLGCARIQVAGGSSVRLTADTVREWAVAGVPAYVAAPARDRSLATYLRAPHVS